MRGLAITLVLILAGCDRDRSANLSPEKPVPDRPATQEAAPRKTVTGTAAAEAAMAKLGQPAPTFELPGVDGKAYRLADYAGKVVVLEWFNPDCPFVKFAHTKGPLVDQASRTVTDQLVWLSINSGGEGKQGHGLERNREALRQYGISNPILLDVEGKVGRSYGAEKTPHMFIVDSRGTLVYRGGVDNAPFGEVDTRRPRYTDSAEGQLINYVRGAIEDLDGERALRLDDTPPYGCTVKYSG